MARPSKSFPTKRELELLASLCALGPATVAAVNGDLLERCELEWAYTSVLTVLRRMERKGWVTRSRAGKAHVYKSTVSLERLKYEVLEWARMTFFDGSGEGMITMLRRMEEGDAAKRTTIL